MTRAGRESEPLAPGPLRLRESVRAALFSLRHFTQVSLGALDPPQALAPPELDVSVVAAVEEALRCSLPDEVLACVANGDAELNKYGFDLGQVVDHTRLAHKRGCPKDLIAVGSHPDFHAFFCVSRAGPRGRGVQIADRDNFDGSVNWYDLGDWLAGKVEGRQEFLAEKFLALAEWGPSPADLSGFKPSLVG